MVGLIIPFRLALGEDGFSFFPRWDLGYGICIRSQESVPFTNQSQMEVVAFWTHWINVGFVWNYQTYIPNGVKKSCRCRKNPSPAKEVTPVWFSMEPVETFATFSSSGGCRWYASTLSLMYNGMSRWKIAESMILQAIPPQSFSRCKQSRQQPYPYSELSYSLSV